MHKYDKIIQYKYIATHMQSDAFSICTVSSIYVDVSARYLLNFAVAN